jgi:hypothetical protein
MRIGASVSWHCEIHNGPEAILSPKVRLGERLQAAPEEGRRA